MLSLTPLINYAITLPDHSSRLILAIISDPFARIVDDTIVCPLYLSSLASRAGTSERTIRRGLSDLVDRSIASLVDGAIILKPLAAVTPPTITPLLTVYAVHTDGIQGASAVTRDIQPPSVVIPATIKSKLETDRGSSGKGDARGKGTGSPLKLMPKPSTLPPGVPLTASGVPQGLEGPDALAALEQAGLIQHGVSAPVSDLPLDDPEPAPELTPDEQLADLEARMPPRTAVQWRENRRLFEAQRKRTVKPGTMLPRAQEVADMVARFGDEATAAGLATQNNTPRTKGEFVESLNYARTTAKGYVRRDARDEPAGPQTTQERPKDDTAERYEGLV